MNLFIFVHKYIYTYIYEPVCFCLLTFWFYGISTFVVYLMPNPLLYKQLHNLIVKNISISSYSVSSNSSNSNNSV